MDAQCREGGGIQDSLGNTPAGSYLTVSSLPTPPQFREGYSLLEVHHAYDPDKCVTR